ncbi:hypothetical protein QBC35DRAFT_442902, partial [Podospora australis]
MWETPDPIDGFIGPISYGEATINAPLGPNGEETYLGVKFYPEAFIPDLCAAHCVSTTKYNRKHPNPDGSYLSCRFFLAYTLYQNGEPQGLYCTMYTRHYDVSAGLSRVQGCFVNRRCT